MVSVERLCVRFEADCGGGVGRAEAQGLVLPASCNTTRRPAALQLSRALLSKMTWLCSSTAMLSPARPEPEMLGENLGVRHVSTAHPTGFGRAVYAMCARQGMLFMIRGLLTAQD